MASYFDSTGYNPPSFHEIVQAIEDDQRQNVAIPFTYQDSKIIHQLNSVYARVSDLAFQALGAGLDSLVLSNAEGRNLEELARLRKVFRIPSGRSNTSSQVAMMNTNATIPAGTLFYSSTDGVEAYNPQLVTATPSSCLEAVIKSVSVVVEGGNYGFNVNGSVYSYIALSGDTIDDVHTELAALMAADLAKTFTFQNITDGGVRTFILTADVGTTISASTLITKMTITQVKVGFYVECVGTGVIAVESESMDSLKIPVNGLVWTKNTESFRLGREEETDSELRVRTEAGNLVTGTGTIPTIEQSILVNVPNVTFVRVIENTSVAPEDAEGRPLHSFEILVDGGFLEEDLVKEIWRTKGAGIKLYGTEPPVPILDSGGATRFITYSRPTSINLDVEVDYKRYTEEVLPMGVVETMQNAVHDYINSLPIGKDVIASRIFPAVYAALPSGVGRLIIRIQDKSALGFTENKISVGSTSVAKVALSDIVVTDVTSSGWL